MQVDRDRLIRRFGPDAETWLADLPRLTERLAGQWGLTVGHHLPGGTSATFLCHRADGAPVVLKVTPDPEVAAGEHRALHAWDGVPTMVGVLEADLAAGALLLEAIQPGTPAPLSVEVSRRLLATLHIGPVDGFQPLAERVDFVFSLLRRRIPDNVDRFHEAAAKLAVDDVPATLLHGDLHAGNVLDGGTRGPIAIDPRPCVGDPAIDAVDLVYAADDHRARIEALSDLVDGDRLELWCAAFRPFFP